MPWPSRRGTTSSFKVEVDQISLSEQLMGGRDRSSYKMQPFIEVSEATCTCTCLHYMHVHVHVHACVYMCICIDI